MANSHKSILAIETYRIDPVHSTISFKVKHMMINHSLGRFNQFDGQVHFDPHDLSDSSIQMIIQPESIDTHNKERDEHLKGFDFLNISQFPIITFNSTSITKLLGRCTIVGDLTIKGITKSVSLHAHIEGPVKNHNGEHVVGITGEMVINRKDFGISFDKVIEGRPMVDDSVKIDINIEAKR